MILDTKSYIFPVIQRVYTTRKKETQWNVKFQHKNTTEWISANHARTVIRQQKRKGFPDPLYSIQRKSCRLAFGDPCNKYNIYRKVYWKGFKTATFVSIVDLGEVSC